MLEFLQQNQAFWVVSVGVFGLLIGSFLNVVILRLPARIKHDWKTQCASILEQPELDLEPPADLIVSRSACPKCQTQLRAIDNIPLISYLALRGRCAHCSNPISVQYPLIEALCALLSILVAWTFGVTWMVIAGLILTWALIVLAVIDLREQMLYDLITLPLLWLGLLINTTGMWATPTDAIIGAAAGYLSLWIIFHVFKALTGKEGMGYGDFKLLAVFGAWLGWAMLPMILLLSSLVGALVGIAMIIFGGRDRNIPIPFGPYLAAAGFIALIWGDRLISLYLDVSGLAT